VHTQHSAIESSTDKTEPDLPYAAFYWAAVDIDNFIEGTMLIVPYVF
jgi:hypothetical protein